jgi:glyoxylase-like metal-dependent hydrolase (beta-lactamase superfamily II)
VKSVITLAALSIAVFITLTGAATAGDADDALFDALGGQRALSRASVLKIDADGESFVVSESHLPESGALSTNTYRSTTLIDLKQDRSRAEHRRKLSFNFWEQRPKPVHAYVEITDGKRGYVAGTDNILGIGDRPMFADRVAGTKKNQRLLYPHAPLAEAARGVRTITDEGMETIGGIVYRKVAVSDRPAPLLYWINETTGRIDRMTTAETRPDQRDAVIEVRYERWGKSGDIFAPGEVRVSLSGELIRHEIRTTSPLKRAAKDAFAIPADAVSAFRAVAEAPQGQFIQGWYGAPAAAFDRMAADDPAAEQFGEKSSQFLSMFTELGVAFSGAHGLVMPVELAPGVTLLLGSSNNSMMVEQDDGLVLVEAPLSPERSKAILAWAAATYPGKKVKSVVVTHFHFDHVAGLRQLIHEGAAVISSDVSAPYLASLGARKSELSPDDQARDPKSAAVVPIGYNAEKRLASAKNEIRLYHAPNRHAADWTYVFIPGPGILFTADVHSPPFPPLSETEFKDFRADFLKRGLKVKIAAGGHGATQTGAELEALLQQFAREQPTLSER